MIARSWTSPKSIVPVLLGLALWFIFWPSPAAAAAAPTVVPVTAYVVTSSQCEGPTYLPILNPALEDVYSEVDALVATRPGQGPYPPTFSSCTPLPAAASPVVGSASGSSVASPSGSATVSVQALGNQLIEESANVDTTLTASLTLSAPTPSVDFSIPYTTAGLSQSGSQDPFALVSFSAATGLMPCVDGSDGIWSTPPGQFDLESPMGPGSGTASVHLFCPDGSDLAPGVVGLGVNLLANVYSDNGQAATASADITLHDVTATINS